MSSFIPLIKEIGKVKHVVVKQEPAEDPEPTDVPANLPPLPVLDTTTAPAATNPGDTDSGPSPVKQAKPSALQLLLGDVYIVKVEEPKSEVQLIASELNAFKLLPSIAIDQSQLEWWQAHEMVYPGLANVAKYLICVPGTSVPAERVFSTAGDIVTAQRAPLTSDKMDKPIFLKKNNKFLK